MIRKITTFLIVTVILSTLVVSTFAQEGTEVNVSSGEVGEYEARAEAITKWTGSGTTNTNISKENVDPDILLQQKINEAAALFGEDWENWTDEEILEDVESLELDEIQLPGQTTSHYGTQNSSKTGTVGAKGTRGEIVTVDDFDLPVGQVAGFGSMFADLNDDNFSGSTVPNMDTDVYVGLAGRLYDRHEGKFSSNSEYMRAYCEDMLAYLSGRSSYRQVTNPIENLFDHAMSLRLQDHLAGLVQLKELGGTGIEVYYPLKNTVMHQSLLSYIKALTDIGQTTVHAKKITVYHAQSYHIQTVHKSAPIYPLTFHWVVSNEEGSNTVDTVTQGQNYLQIMFQSAGRYHVAVYQNKSVLRCNSAFGYKTEVWVLDNGDLFDGLVFYSHTTTFADFLSNDIGPTEEELKLTRDSFTANVTEEQLNIMQILDENGYLRSAAEEFFTERN